MTFETTYKPSIPVSDQKDFKELLLKWNNVEKAQAIAALKKSMSEQAETKKIQNEVVQSYIEQTVKAGMQNYTLPNYPDDFSSAAKSTYYKQVIQEVLKDLDEELKLSGASNAVAKAAWNEVQKAKTIIEFKKFFKLYLIALRADIYTEEDIQWYSNKIEELENKVQELKHYKEVYSGVFDVVIEEENKNPEDGYTLAKMQRDKDNRTVVEALKLKQLGFKESEILIALGIDKNRFKYLKKRAGSAFIQGMQEFLDKKKQEQEKAKETLTDLNLHSDSKHVEEAKKVKKASKQQTDEEFFATIEGDCTSLDGI